MEGHERSAEKLELDNPSPGVSLRRACVSVTIVQQAVIANADDPETSLQPFDVGKHEQESTNSMIVTPNRIKSSDTDAMFFADRSIVWHTLSLVLAPLCQRTGSRHRNRQQDFRRTLELARKLRHRLREPRSAHGLTKFWLTSATTRYQSNPRCRGSWPRFGFVSTRYSISRMGRLAQFSGYLTAG